MLTKQSLLLLLFIVIGAQLSAQITTSKLLQRDTLALSEEVERYYFDDTTLLLDKTILQAIVQEQPAEWTLTIPSSDLGELTLVLKKHSLFTPDFIYTKNASGTEEFHDLHYRGYIEHFPDSKVALSFTHTEITGLIQLPSKTLLLEKVIETNSNDEAIQQIRNRTSAPVLGCIDTDTMPGIPSPNVALKRRTMNKPACVAIRVEVDYDFRGNAAALMNQVAMLYQNIGIEIRISEIYHWKRPSPYRGTTREIISKLQADLKERTDLTSDVTLLISSKGNGGRASSVGSVCEPTSVCYSGQNTDVYTIAHELGHLFSAHHTHACKWNGNNTAIDGCGYNAGYGGCPGEDPAKGGTILSYCHIRRVGVNLEFDPQVADKMYNFLQANSDCTCKTPTNSITEEEEEEEVSINPEVENSTASVCKMSFINPNNCVADIYELTNQGKGDLLISLANQATLNSAIIKDAKYGVYVEDVFLNSFTAACGTVYSIQEACRTSTEERVTAKIILEGFYDTYTKRMHQRLLEQNLVSTTNPYTAAPWYYKGLESIESIPTNAVDWILVMSRNAEGAILKQAIGFVNTDGELMDVSGKLGIPLPNADGQHLSIHHRGHMAVMTASPYQSGRMVDFTTSENGVLGNNQLKYIGGVFALYAGDYDANGVINNMDYNQWVSNSSKINLYVSADGDGNGVINNKDYNLWISNRSKIGHSPLHY